MSKFISLLYDRTILRFPGGTLVVLLALLVFFASNVSQFKLDASSDSLLLENDEDYRQFRDVSERYKVREFLFMTVTPDGDLFDRATINLVGEIRDELDALDAVNSVTSMLDVPLVKNVEGTLADLPNNFRLLEYEDVDLELAREELTTSPIYKDLVVDAAGTLTAIQIFLNHNEEFADAQRRRDELIARRDKEGLSDIAANELQRIMHGYGALKDVSDAANHQAIADIRAVMAKFSDRALLHLGGVPKIVDDMVTFIGNHLVIFGSGVAVFMVVML
jgi:predicted RND superfamily exporter protein